MVITSVRSLLGIHDLKYHTLRFMAPIERVKGLLYFLQESTYWTDARSSSRSCQVKGSC
jgi:hypothetical protein